MTHVHQEERSHLDAISHNKDGHLALGASSLNARKWSGSLSYFERVENAPSNPVAITQLETGVTDVQWIPECGRLATSSDNGAVILWKLSPAADALDCLCQRTEHDDIVNRLSVNCDGSKFITASYDRSIKVWECEEFLPTSHFTAHYDIVWDAAFHPSQPDIFISCSQDGQMLLWDLRKPKPASIIESKCLPSVPTCVAWQPNNEHTFTVGVETGEIVLKDSRAIANDNMVALPVHKRLVYRIAFAPHQTRCLASVSEDCSVAVTEFESTAAAVMYRDWSHKDFVQGLSWNPVNGYLTTCSWDKKVISREGVKGKEEAANTLHTKSSASMDTD